MLHNNSVEYFLSITRKRELFVLIKKMKLYEKESILELISAAVTAIVKAESISDLERINRLYKVKLKALVDFSKL